VNLLADESVDGPIVHRLREDGHVALYVAEMAPGIDDDEVLARGNEIGALLVTADKDFGELVFRLRRINAGVVLLRLLGLSPRRKAEIVGAAFARHGADFTNAFSVVTPGPIRIRRGT
jgi:predicted nuclease of predicted toxin-antitoxin system